MLFRDTFSSLYFIELGRVVVQAAELALRCPSEQFIVVVTFAEGVWTDVAEGHGSLSADIAMVPRAFPLSKRPFVKIETREVISLCT